VVPVHWRTETISTRTSHVLLKRRLSVAACAAATAATAATAVTAVTAAAATRVS
jgi:hypothetical protein